MNAARWWGLLTGAAIVCGADDVAGLLVALALIWWSVAGIGRIE